MAADAPTDPVTDDAFLGGALDILQPKTGYRAGIDGILLAASVPAGDGDAVLDVGAGVGVVGLAVARRLAHARVSMIERNPRLAELARRNIERNNLADRARLIETDIARPSSEFVANVLVTVNVPDPAPGSPFDDRRHAVGVLVVSLGVGVRTAGDQVMDRRDVRIRRGEALHRVPSWGRPGADGTGAMTDFVQVNASAYGARHSMPRSRARPRKTSSSHQSRLRCDG